MPGAGADISPPLRWTGPPEGTKSFALTVDDRDDRSGIWVHWALYGISGTIRELPEGVPRQDTVSGVGTQGLTDFGGVGCYRVLQGLRGRAARWLHCQHARSDNCLHFVPPSSCKTVEGKINPKGWCQLYAPKPK